jgi:SAM-dependent methyltransferase
MPHTMREDVSMKLFGRKKHARFPLFMPYHAEQDSFLAPPVRREGSIEKARPVPSPDRWIAPEKYGRTVDEYLANGRRDVEIMLDLVSATGHDVTKSGDIFELGCADGRMLRWLEPFAADREIWGSDIDAGRILWCKQHLSPPFRFLTNTIVPHLPFEERKFGFIFAGSVFSHIDDLADAWLAELRRILAPGGILFITVHLKNDVALLESKNASFGLARKLRNHPDYARIQAGDYDVFSLGRSAGSFVFYDLDYLRKSIEPTFRILSVTNEVRLFQNALVLERV